MPRKPLSVEDVREIALELPEVEAGTAWGTFAVKLRGKLMACRAINKSAEPDSLMIRMAMDDRERYLKQDPDAFYLTPHYSPYPCVVARLPKITRAALRDAFGASWRFMMEKTPERRRKKAAKPKPRPKRARRPPRSSGQ